MAKKIFVAFAHEQPNGKIKDYGNVLFAFADDKNYLHFGGSPKKSYLLTPAQAANVMFSKRSAETRFSIFHCIDITKRELKILREEFKKEGFMPYHFFEKLMLDDKYFPDATVVLKQEPKPSINEDVRLLVNDLKKQLDFTLDNYEEGRIAQVEMLQKNCDSFKEETENVLQWLLGNNPKKSLKAEKEINS